MATFANILVTASSYLLVALGLTIIYGVLRVLHIAHASVYAVAAFVAYEVWREVPSFWLALVAAMAAAACLGVLIYALVYRPLLDAPKSVPFLASIGVLIAIESLLQRPFLLGPEPVALPAESGIPGFSLGSFTLSSIQVTIVAAAVVAFVVVRAIVDRSRLGLSWRSITADRLMAASSGVNVTAAITVNFVVGSALAGAAGLLDAVYRNEVAASSGAVIAYKAFVIVVLGGPGSVTGAAVASLLLATAEILSLRYVGGVLPRDAIAFLVLILVLLVRPQGIGRRLVSTA